jgi:4-hydroxy-2-oxoheptanedioate aldolase
MIKENFLKKAFRKNQTVLGTWSIIPSNIVANVISKAGLDFIIFDREHGNVSYETLQSQIISTESENVSPIVRIPSINKDEILRALDLGVHGIQIPNIENVDQVKEIIKYSKYPPIGDRGYSPFTRAGGYTSLNKSDYMKLSNDNTLVGINIETKNGIQNLNSIAKVEGLDFIFLGLFDITKMLGIPGQVKDEKVIKILEESVKIINDNGKIAGTIATSPDDIDFFIKIGLKYIVYLVDCEMLISSYRSIVDYLNEKSKS